MTKIVSWNVNGIRAVINKGLFSKFIEEAKADIICFQETKAQQDQVVIDLPEYQEFWNSAVKKGYSGTAVFTKIKPISVHYGLHPDVAKPDDLQDEQGRAAADEGRVLSLEFENYFVVTVYTPNSKNDLSRLKFRHEIWDPLFLKHLQHLEKTKPVIFCGDLNVAHTAIDLARPEQNEGEHGFTKEEREGFDKFLAAGFVDTFRIFNKDPENYTWWTAWANARQRNVGWRIDYFLASESLKPKIKNAFIMADIMGSDHCPVGIEIAE